MKTKIIIGMLLLATAAGGAPTNTTYSTWLGVGAGNNGILFYSNLYGASAGGEAYCFQSGLYGVLAGYGGYNLLNTIGLGYRAVQQAQELCDVYAIGNCAGRGAYHCGNVLWVGRDVGRGNREEVDTIRLLGGKMGISSSGDYTFTKPSPAFVREHTYLFDVPLTEVIPTNTADLVNGAGFYNKANFSITGDSDLAKEVLEVVDTFGEYVSATGHQISLPSDQQYYISYGSGSFTIGPLRTECDGTFVVNEGPNEGGLKVNGAALFTDTRKIYVNGETKETATPLADYLQTFAGTTVNGKTGDITLTAADVGATPKLTNKTVTLKTGDDLIAAVKLILETMGAEVITAEEE